MSETPDAIEPLMLRRFRGFLPVVIDVETGDELTPGEAPAWSVCVGGTRMRKFPGGEYGMPCLLMLRRLAAGSRHDKTELNAILRDHGVNG